MTNGILLTRHNQEIAQWSPDPFPRERVGSGHETNNLCASPLNPQCYACMDSSLVVQDQHERRGSGGVQLIAFFVRELSALMKPEESAKHHQTLSSQMGSEHWTRIDKVHVKLKYQQ